MAALQKPGEGPDLGTYDPDKVVERAEEVAPDQDKAGHVDVEEEPAKEERGKL